MGSWVKWTLMAAGLLSTACAGIVGAGAGIAVVGAGVLAFTCYDRVSVTVTDRLSGTKLCDAKVTFVQGSSETEAKSCYQAALSAGHYTMRVERHGLVPFQQPVDVAKTRDCGQTIQTMYVAMERPVRAVPTAAVTAATPATVAAPPPLPAAPPPPPAASASSAPSAPSASSAAPPPSPAPSTPAFPDA